MLCGFGGQDLLGFTALVFFDVQVSIDVGSGLGFSMSSWAFRRLFPVWVEGLTVWGFWGSVGLRFRVYFQGLAALCL